MRRARLAALVAACVIGGATVTSATATAPPAVRIVLGVLMVFLVPGLAVGSVVLPERRSFVDCLLTSVGLSLTIATCAAVLLAATPVGLSRETLGVLLGGFTVVLSICGMYRARSTSGQREPDRLPVQRLEGQLGGDAFVKP